MGGSFLPCSCRFSFSTPRSEPDHDRRSNHGSSMRHALAHDFVNRFIMRRVPIDGLGEFEDEIPTLRARGSDGALFSDAKRFSDFHRCMPGGGTFPVRNGVDEDEMLREVAQPLHETAFQERSASLRAVSLNTGMSIRFASPSNTPLRRLPSSSTPSSQTRRFAKGTRESSGAPKPWGASVL